MPSTLDIAPSLNLGNYVDRNNEVQRHWEAHDATAESAWVYINDMSYRASALATRVFVDVGMACDVSVGTKKFISAFSTYRNTPQKLRTGFTYLHVKINCLDFSPECWGINKTLYRLCGENIDLLNSFWRKGSEVLLLQSTVLSFSKSCAKCCDKCKIRKQRGYPS